MGLFNSKSIESDLAKAQSDLAESNQNLTAANTHILELEETNRAVTADLDAAKLETQAANEAKTAAESSEVAAVATVSTITAWLGIEAGTEITKESLDAKINEMAQAKALEIAAGQGCPPVPTDPGANTPGDDVKEAYAAAAQIADPRARAKAFAAASAKLNGGK